jgi:uncharacterized protein YlxW (UPF0749 family)
MSATINDVTQIPKALKVKTSHYAIAGLSLVAALGWNDAIKASIKKVYPVPKDQVSAGFFYAIMITIVLLFVIWMLPDTKSELPHDTQNKIKEAETEDKIVQLEKEVTQLKEERFRQMGRIEKMAVFR